MDDIRQGLKEIKGDLRDMREDIGEIRVSTAANTASLQEHMKRTSLNETRIQKMEYWALGIIASAFISLLIKWFMAQ